jgi:predicted HicB family RNase H-like nuclease
VNYDYPDEQHRRWKVAAGHKGQTLKEWIRRALNQVADEQQADRAEAERRRRSR